MESPLKSTRRSASSAGILMYRRVGSKLEVLLVHPGGPYWRRKDEGSWSIPKGEMNAGEEAGIAAIREFTEETGIALTAPLQPLGEIRQRAGKRVLGFAVEGDLDVQEQQLRDRVAAAKRNDAGLSGNRPRRMVRPARRSGQDPRRPAALSRPARPTFGPTRDKPSMTDPFDLQRFVDAQAPVYRRVLAELRQGEKQSHWMWFIFPQLAGLGHSPMARRFAIASREESVAYLGHVVLGHRLRECTALVNAVQGRTIREILGSPDDIKFCSSMTLFGAVSPDPEFADSIQKFYGGTPDRRTLDLLDC